MFLFDEPVSCVAFSHTVFGQQNVHLWHFPPCVVGSKPFICIHTYIIYLALNIIKRCIFLGFQTDSVASSMAIASKLEGRQFSIQDGRDEAGVISDPGLRRKWGWIFGENTG